MQNNYMYIDYDLSHFFNEKIKSQKYDKIRRVDLSLDLLDFCYPFIKLFYYSALNHLAVNVSAFNISSGVPSNIICPPSLPPFGPNSIIQSLAAIKSKLCSTIMTELPLFTKF